MHNYNYVKKIFLLILSLFILILIPNIYAEVDEEKQRQKLEKIGQDIIRDQFMQLRSEIKDACEDRGEDGRFKVTTDIIDLANINDMISTKIDGRKKAIKQIIWQTANDIEAGRDFTLSFDGNKLKISRNKLKQIESLNSAIKQNSISINSLAIAIKAVVETSTLLYEKALKEKNKDRKFNLYIEYTAFAYELSSIVIELLENHKIQGIEELNQIYQQRKNSIDRLIGRLKNMNERCKRKLEKGSITKEKYNKEIKDNLDAIAALNTTLLGWKNIFSIIDKQKDWANKIKNRTELFREMRDKAGLQLDILKELGFAKEIQASIQNIDYISEIANIPLLPINEDLAIELLGLGGKSYLISE